MEDVSNINVADYHEEKTFKSFVIDEKLLGPIIDILQKNKLVAYYPNFKPVRNASEGKKRVLLKEGITSIPEDIQSMLGLESIEYEDFQDTLTVKNFKLEQILSYYLPEGVVIPSSFETIGTIAHLNLLDCQIPYKKLIGEAILLKNPSLDTVVAKVGAIHNVYRSMDLEILATRLENPTFITKVKQSKFIFCLDFSKVYWNSRLEHEHNSLVEIFKEGSIVADAMCGIGPFAIRAAKIKNCHVFANDLNPDSYKWLLENCKLNHVEKNIECSNLDAREFIMKIFENGGSDYIIMNLPATAVEFLDAVAAGAKKFKTTSRMPVVYFHSFDEKANNHEESLLQRARKALGMNLPHLNVYKVRDVSPGKDMFRCSFSCLDLFSDE